jgi:ornithine carbamoyltransferase
MVGCAKMGINYVACAPATDQPDPELVATAQTIAAENGCTVLVTSDVEEACTGANIIYTDIWVSMGESAELWAERIKNLSPYQVNDTVMGYAADNAIFMHCLPAFHDTETSVAQDIERQFGLTEMEVTDSVFEGPQSRVFDEAENRMHSIKAVVLSTLG